MKACNFWLIIWEGCFLDKNVFSHDQSLKWLFANEYKMTRFGYNTNNLKHETEFSNASWESN